MSNSIPGGMKPNKISKIKSAINKFKDMKRTKVVYMTYVLTFPDGDQWTKQTPFSAHDMDLMLKNMIAEHLRTRSEWYQRCGALWAHGECWWKDEAGVEHLVLIEDKKREERWGVDQKDFGTFKHGLTDDERGNA